MKLKRFVIIVIISMLAATLYSGYIQSVHASITLPNGMTLDYGNGTTVWLPPGTYSSINRTNVNGNVQFYVNGQLYPSTSSSPTPVPTTVPVITASPTAKPIITPTPTPKPAGTPTPVPVTTSTPTSSPPSTTNSTDIIIGLSVAVVLVVCAVIVLLLLKRKHAS